MHRRELIKYLLATGGALSCLPPVAFSRILLKPEQFLQKSSFPGDFKWGVATGYYHEAWKSRSDHVSDLKDQYKEDIRILSSLNFPVFKIPLLWEHIMPYGIGQRNREGIDLYHQVIDECLQNNIEPWITLCHGHLPQHLVDKGGWEAREVIDWFNEYIDVCTREYGDKVNNWIVMNEPARFAGMGYFTGYQSNDKRGFKSFLRAAHHAALCQAEGGRLVRANLPGANIGTTQYATCIEPKNGVYRHQKASDKLDAMLNRFFIEPLMGMGYPTDEFPLLRYIEKYYCPGDAERLIFDFDFIGIQYYDRKIAQFSLFPPFVFASEVPAEERDVPVDQMGSEYYPQGIREVVERYWAYPDIPKMIISECGVCFDDQVEKGRINDENRLTYHQQVLKEIGNMLDEGIPIEGYFVRSLTDHIQATNNPNLRFGLVYVDANTRKRMIKNSGYWFRDFLA